MKFQSTPSAGRATSISLPSASYSIDFNPRPPRGGRLKSADVRTVLDQFQSTPSAGRATVRVVTKTVYQ